MKVLLFSKNCSNDFVFMFVRQKDVVNEAKEKEIEELEMNVKLPIEKNDKNLIEFEEKVKEFIQSSWNLNENWREKVLFY